MTLSSSACQLFQKKIHVLLARIWEWMIELLCLCIVLDFWKLETIPLDFWHCYPTILFFQYLTFRKEKEKHYGREYSNQDIWSKSWVGCQTISCTPAPDRHLKSSCSVPASVSSPEPKCLHYTTFTVVSHSHHLVNNLTDLPLPSQLIFPNEEVIIIVLSLAHSYLVNCEWI